MCYPDCLCQCSVRVQSVHALWGAEGLGRCLVLWWSIFLAVVGAEFHADLLPLATLMTQAPYHDMKCPQVDLYTSNRTNGETSLNPVTSYLRLPPAIRSVFVFCVGSFVTQISAWK